MNNEIDFEEFIRNIDFAIYEKIDVDNWNISIEVILDVVEFLQRSLEDLRTYIVNHPSAARKKKFIFSNTSNRKYWVDYYTLQRFTIPKCENRMEVLKS